MAGYDFKEIYNMSGGIKGWNGYKAIGPEDLGMETFIGNEEFADMVSLAYAMEDGLQRFYQKLAEGTRDNEQRDLLLKLVGFEHKHKERLVEIHERSENAISLDSNLRDVMEGGARASKTVDQIQSNLNSLEVTLDFAMTLETQAMDLYTRMARKSDNETKRDLFLKLADEEKSHLAYLANEMVKILS